MIVAFNNPNYVDNMIMRLGGGKYSRCNIYVHVDTKSKSKFESVITKWNSISNVKFLSNNNHNWGGYKLLIQR